MSRRSEVRRLRAAFARRVGCGVGAIFAISIAPCFPAAAQTPTEHKQTAPPASPAEPIGLTLAVGIESAYYFRGLNMFKDASQRDAHGLFEPSLTYAVPGTGLSLGYWGGYQINGDNAAHLIAAGIGHEQDVIVRYAGELGKGLTLVGILTGYLYPFADEEVAGTAVPTYLEPGVSLAYSGPLDLGLAVSYMAGIQDALAYARYAYLNPTVGKTFELGGVANLAMGIGFGFKIYNYPSRMPENRFDVCFDWGVPLKLGGGLTVTPGTHLGWTDLKGGAPADGYLVWASLDSSLAL